ncbi:MAG: LysM peptidoglycan-binding domain-containing protein [Thermomicrobiales bacterium]
MLHERRNRWLTKKISKRLLQGIVVPAATLVLVTACSRGSKSEPATPTPPPAFVIVTPTPIPPGATVVITPTPTIDISTLEKYTVQDGDSLSSIADAFGVSQEALAEVNNIDDPNSLFAGQVIVIPPK